MPSSFLSELKRTFSLHTVSAHFSNGLLPVAVLYLLLTLASNDVFFEHTIEHLIIVALMAIPVSYFSGIHDWRVKFKGAKAPIFIKKIRLSILLFVLCLLSVVIRLLFPRVMYQGDFLHWLYIALLISMLPVVMLLGFYGGKLSSGLRQAASRK
jgi:hypothetical protein